MLECVEVSYVLKYVPEDVISDPLVHKLKSRTLADVVDMDMGYLFDGIEVGYILGVNYEKNADGEYVMVPADPDKMTIMEILAPIDLGDVLADAQAGKLNVLEVIDENLADVTIAHLVNAFESVELPEALGGKTLGELISVDENGSFYIDIAGVTKGIDIGGLIKLYDLAVVHEEAPQSVREHYNNLTYDAAECIACGECEDRCPFNVKIVDIMLDAQDLFNL